MNPTAPNSVDNVISTDEKARPSNTSKNSESTRRVVLAAAVGTFVEYYDFAIYSYLATVLAVVFFSQGDPTSALLSTLATLAVAFIVRPVGAVIFGSIGDRIGRKAALSLTLIIMTVATVLIGSLPGYATIGIVATVTLVLLRAIQGLSTGGELAAAVSFVAEHVKADRRGVMVGFVQLGMMIGTLGGSATVAILFWAFSADQVAEWAWRIPFLLAAPVGLIGLYIRWKLEDSPIFKDMEKEGEKADSPLRRLFSNHAGAWFRAVCLSTVSVAGYWVVFVYMAIHMQDTLGYSSQIATTSTTISIAVAAVALMIFARLGDRVGRKPVYAFLAGGLLILAYPLMLAIASGNFALIILAQSILGIFAGGTTSVLNAILAELFPTVVRGTGIGLGFNMANILAGGTAPFVVAWLVGLFPNAEVPAFYIMVFAIVSLLAIPGLRRYEGKSLQEVDLAIIDG